jgi:hypothetical protein
VSEPNPNLALLLRYLSGDCGCLATVVIVAVIWMLAVVIPAVAQ